MFPKNKIIILVIFLVNASLINSETSKITDITSTKRKVLNYINCFKSSECNKNEDCDNLNECINNTCKHKKFLPPSIREIIGVMLITLGSALSNAGGIGGNIKF